jgi:hypothetical protein
MLLYWFDAKEYSLVSNVHEVYYYSRGIYKYTGNDGMTDIDILQRNISTLSTNLKIKDFNESEVQTILSIIKQMMVLALQVCCNGYAHSYIENITLTENQLKNNLLYASNYKPIRVRCTPECEAKLGQLIKCTENLAKMIQDKGLYTHLLISKHYK